MVQINLHAPDVELLHSYNTRFLSDDRYGIADGVLTLIFNQYLQLRFKALDVSYSS